MEKTPIDIALDRVDWIPIEHDAVDDGSGIPYATHSGVLRFGGVELECHTLSNGLRVFTEESVMKFLGALDGDE